MCVMQYVAVREDRHECQVTLALAAATQQARNAAIKDGFSAPTEISDARKKLNKCGSNWTGIAVVFSWCRVYLYDCLCCAGNVKIPGQDNTGVTWSTSFSLQQIRKRAVGPHTRTQTLSQTILLRTRQLSRQLISSSNHLRGRGRSHARPRHH